MSSRPMYRRLDFDIPLIQDYNVTEADNGVLSLREAPCLTMQQHPRSPVVPEFSSC
jgi:hypothetical protein